VDGHHVAVGAKIVSREAPFSSLGFRHRHNHRIVARHIPELALDLQYTDDRNSYVTSAKPSNLLYVLICEKQALIIRPPGSHRSDDNGYPIPTDPSDTR
jgi:hypothetical protein